MEAVFEPDSVMDFNLCEEGAWLQDMHVKLHDAGLPNSMGNYTS
jgi:hypothetical protein